MNIKKIIIWLSMVGMGCVPSVRPDPSPGSGVNALPAHRNLPSLMARISAGRVEGYEHHQMPFQKLSLKSPTEILLEAASSGDIVCIKQAIESGADVNARDWAGLTSLMRAVQSCDDVEYVTALLLDAGADYAARDEQYCQCTCSHRHDAYYYARQRGIDSGNKDTFTQAFMTAVNTYNKKHNLEDFVSPFASVVTWSWIEE